MSFVGAVLRRTRVKLEVNSIELTAVDSVWTAADGLPTQFGGIYLEIYDRSLPSHVDVKRCRFEQQVATNRHLNFHACCLSMTPR